MGFLDGMIGGMVGAAMIPVVNDLLAQHGGVGGIVNKFETQGFGGVANSWVQQGPSAPVQPEHVQQAFGDQTLNELAAKHGMTPQELAEKLAQVLPHAVDAMTPDGTVPPKTA